MTCIHDFFNTDVFLSSPSARPRILHVLAYNILFRHGLRRIYGFFFILSAESAEFAPKRKQPQSFRTISPFFSKTKSINEYSFTKEVVTVFLMLVLIELEALFM